MMKDGDHGIHGNRGAGVAAGLAGAFLALLLGAGTAAPAAAADAGGQADTIVIGRSADMTGPLAERAKPAIAVFNAFFDAVNAEGGINGRRIKLINIDDRNDPKQTVENVRKLITEDKVFALLLIAGTPQTQAILPLANEARVPIIGTTSGAESLRKPNRDLFHTKAGFLDEFTRMAEHIKTIGITRVAVVFSEDGAGREGRLLAEQALKSHGLASLGSIGLKAGEAKPAVAQLAKLNAQAILMPTLAGPGTEFYKEMVNSIANPPQVFTWGNIGTEALFRAVGKKAQGLVVSQTMPSPTKKALRISRDFQDLLAKAKLDNGGYPGMEAYVAARILVEGLKRAGKNPTREGLEAALENMRGFDLGGDIVNFNSNHVGRQFVDLTILMGDGKMLE